MKTYWWAVCDPKTGEIFQDEFDRAEIYSNRCQAKNAASRIDDKTRVDKVEVFGK